MAKLKNLDHRDWKSRTIDITFPVADGEAGFLKAVDRIRDEAEQAIDCLLYTSDAADE